VVVFTASCGNDGFKPVLSRNSNDSKNEIFRGCNSSLQKINSDERVDVHEASMDDRLIDGRGGWMATRSVKDLVSAPKGLADYQVNTIQDLLGDAVTADADLLSRDRDTLTTQLASLQVRLRRRDT
jgi:hypothetical protein